MATKAKSPEWYELEQAPRNGATHIVAEGRPSVALCGCTVDASLETKWRNAGAVMPVRGGLLCSLEPGRGGGKPASNWASCKGCVKAYNKQVTQ